MILEMITYTGNFLSLLVDPPVAVEMKIVSPVLLQWQLHRQVVKEKLSKSRQYTVFRVNEEIKRATAKKKPLAMDSSLKCRKDVKNVESRVNKFHCYCQPLRA